MCWSGWNLKEDGFSSELAGAVRARRVSSQQLVERSLERIARLDGQLNAVVALRAELALGEARALDERVAAGEDPGPLAGLPVLVKDLEDVAGMRTTRGSALFADAPPATRDGLTPARLRAAGAIVVGKTNLPEFATEGYSANLVFGVTRNPWGLAVVAGRVERGIGRGAGRRPRPHRHRDRRRGLGPDPGGPVRLRRPQAHQRRDRPAAHPGLDRLLHRRPARDDRGRPAAPAGRPVRPRARRPQRAARPAAAGPGPPGPPVRGAAVRPLGAAARRGPGGVRRGRGGLRRSRRAPGRAARPGADLRHGQPRHRLVHGHRGRARLLPRPRHRGAQPRPAASRGPLVHGRGTAGDAGRLPRRAAAPVRLRPGAGRAARRRTASCSHPRSRARAGWPRVG